MVGVAGLEDEVRASKAVPIGVVLAAAVSLTLVVMVCGGSIVRSQLESRLAAAGVPATIGSVKLGAGPSLTICDARSELVSFSRLHARIDLLPLLRRHVVVEQLVVDSLRLELPLPVAVGGGRGADSRWTVALREFDLNAASVVWSGGDVRGVEELFAEGSYSVGGDGHWLELSSMVCTVVGPDVRVEGVAGELFLLSEGLLGGRLAAKTTGIRAGIAGTYRHGDGRVSLSLAVPEIELNELRPWVPWLPCGSGAVFVEAEGKLPEVSATVIAQAGDTVEVVVGARGIVDAASPRLAAAGKVTSTGRLANRSSSLSGLFAVCVGGGEVHAGIQMLPTSRWGDLRLRTSMLSLVTGGDQGWLAARVEGPQGEEVLVAAHGGIGDTPWGRGCASATGIDPAAFNGPPGRVKGSLSAVCPDGERALVALQIGESELAGWNVQALQMVVEAVREGARVPAVAARGPWGRVGASGWWWEGSLGGVLGADIEAGVLSAPEKPARGTVSALAAVRGSWPDLGGTMGLSAAELAWGEASMESIGLWASLRGLPCRPGGRLAIRGGGGHIGWLVVDALAIVADGSSDAARYTVKADGPHVMVQLAGRSAGSQMYMAGTALRIGDVHLHSGRPWKVVLRPEGISVDTLFLSALDCSLIVEGTYAAGGGRGSVRLVGLDLSRLAPFAPPLATLAGHASVWGVVEGPPLNGSAELFVENAEYRGAAFSSGSLKMAALEGAGTVEARLEQRGTERVRMSGGFRGQDWKARVVVSRPDLSALRVMLPGVTRLAGNADGDVLFEGVGTTLRTFRGRVGFSEGLVRVEPLNQDFKHVQFELMADADGWRVSNLRLATGKGAVSAWLEQAAGQLKGEAVVEKLPLTAAVGGGVVLDGRIALAPKEEAPHFGGKLTIVQGEVRVDELPLRQTPGGEVGATALPPWADPLRGELTVVIPRNLWVRSADLEVEIAGEIRVTKEGEVIQLWGDVQVIRGSYRFQGRVFSVDKGVVTFTGSETLDPLLEVVARHRLRDRETGEEIAVWVNLTGTVTRPVVALRSEPPMEEVDILSYLLMGRPASELADAERSALMRSVSGLLAGHATQRLAASVGRALGLDTFEIGTVGAPALRMGSYLGGRVYLEYTQELRRDGARGIRLDYHLGKGVSLEATSTTLSDSGLDLVWLKEF